MIEWKDDVYSVGITAMDDQHKVLIGLINGLEKHRWNPNKEFQEKVLNTLLGYINEHFSEEEAMMKRMNYPHLDAHIMGHQDFIKKVEHIKEQFELSDESSSQALSDLLAYLNEWLTKHILHQDQDYTKWLLGKEST